MSRIFLLEPHRVLQQAIALSLFPEHDVRVAEAADAAAIAALGDGIDLLIVDAAGLRESARLSPELNRAIVSSSLPLVWIDDADAPQPQRGKLAVLAKPIEAGALQVALAGLLAPADARKERKAAPRKSKAGSEPELIDLVEVVEVESPSEKRESLEKPK